MTEQLSVNFAAIVDATTANSDIRGNTIEVGSLVRAFDDALLLQDGRILGMDTEGDGLSDRIAYIEAKVIAIGEIVREGCPRYTLEGIRSVRRNRDGERIDDTIAGRLYIPPLNGTRTTMGRRTFGVEVLT